MIKIYDRNKIIQHQHYLKKENSKVLRGTDSYRQLYVTSIVCKCQRNEVSLFKRIQNNRNLHIVNMTRENGGLLISTPLIGFMSPATSICSDSKSKHIETCWNFCFCFDKEDETHTSAYIFLRGIQTDKHVLPSTIVLQCFHVCKCYFCFTCQSELLRVLISNQVEGLWYSTFIE